MNAISTQCKGCTNWCHAIPIPISTLAEWAADKSKQTQKFSYDVYMGNTIIVICEKEKRFIHFNFMGGEGC